MRVCFAIHPTRKISAVFYDGDERGAVGTPKGWIRLDPRALIPDERERERWGALDLDARLQGITPPGFKAKSGVHSSGRWLFPWW